MIKATLSAGTIHGQVPSDLAFALASDEAAQAAWESITPPARNEWICWVESPKQVDTRERRVARTVSELAEGIKRPCCWIGCIHRTDKAISPSVQGILNKNKSR